MAWFRHFSVLDVLVGIEQLHLKVGPPGKFTHAVSRRGCATIVAHTSFNATRPSCP